MRLLQEEFVIICLEAGIPDKGSGLIVCRVVLGKLVRVKGLVGLSAIRADAEERGDPLQERWYEGPAVPASSEITGRL